MLRPKYAMLFRFWDDKPGSARDVCHALKVARRLVASSSARYPGARRARFLPFANALIRGKCLLKTAQALTAIIFFVSIRRY